MEGPALATSGIDPGDPRAPRRAVRAGDAAADRRGDHRDPLRALPTATEYGLALLFATGPHEQAPQWRQWIDWLKPRTRQAPGAMPIRAVQLVAEEAHERLSNSALIDALPAFEQSGAQDPSYLDGTGVAAYWGELLERLVMRGRDLEDLGAVPMGEIEGPMFGDGAALLGLIEDSLRLEQDAPGELRPSAGDVLDGLLAARTAREWEFLDR